MYTGRVIAYDGTTDDEENDMRTQHIKLFGRWFKVWTYRG